MIGENLKKVRGFKGMSQSDLAEATGLNEATLSNIESGRTDPRVSTVGKIAEALNEDITIFFAKNLNLSQETGSLRAS